MEFSVLEPLTLLLYLQRLQPLGMCYDAWFLRCWGMGPS